MRSAVFAAVLAVTLLAPAAFVWAASGGGGLTPPATIKVARRYPANSPSGVIVGVDTVDFRTYCVRVLSHEWAPPSSFSDEALKAGAMAVKTYAWYWATHTTKLSDVRAWGADVDDSTNYQVYMDWDYGQRYWDAVNATWNTTMTQGGAIFQASYYAGSLNGNANDGYHMTQWGSEYLARQGKSFDQILAFYYTGVQLAAGSGAAPDTLTTALPTGPAKLEVVGPVQLPPAPIRLHENAEASFTLHNAGGKKHTWDAVTLVARGPGDEVRDFGTTTDVTLNPGEYRMFRADRIVDLPGGWHAWLIVVDKGVPSLIGDGSPVSFAVKTADELRVPASKDPDLQRHHAAPPRRGAGAVTGAPAAAH